ncbi:preATP grasp domain-containing protein [Oerskovia rustica]|uniref:ATP-grasp domain-containing protein n=1 Tax=Oerskovia rustica TaxID=2762237 RepID=A0ABR8RWD9_9CELL|nr:ATP-grasp domain-containing protein [Oerskovia rustica]MBD7952111.1 ATP-grasp domain-containing protein [Oerskovia rustica]
MTAGTTTARTPFVHRVKDALTGDVTTPFVFLGNFEVEDEWAHGEIGLPSVRGAGASSAVVNRMDEFALLLAGKDDHVVLKSAPDPGYLAYLDSLGLDLPQVLVTDVDDPLRTVTRDALDSPHLQSRLRELAAGGARLLAHGTSTAEEELCAVTGLASALPGAATTKAVNSKIYSRELCSELGIRQARGWVCRTVDDFTRAVAEASRAVAAGRTVGVKDAYGVSGKGILVVDDERRLDQLLRMVVRRAERSGDERLSVVVEEWAEKATDLNYHFTVALDGTVTFDFVKEALTRRGVHQGHRIPSRLPRERVDELGELSARLGARLHQDGFHGIVGVDAIVLTDGSLLPVLEINARNNMSTYQVRLQEQFLPDDGVALARQYDLTLDAPVSFDALEERLGDLLYTTDRGRGLLVDNTATVNAAASTRTAGTPFSGRLYGLLVATSDDELSHLDDSVAARLTEGTARD